MNEQYIYWKCTFHPINCIVTKRQHPALSREANTEVTKTAIHRLTNEDIIEAIKTNKRATTYCNLFQPSAITSPGLPNAVHVGRNFCIIISFRKLVCKI